jgi:nucleoside-diphosphate-sugar epimerase
LNKNISILGCGWLGLPLAIQLIASGWKVKGSTTSAEKLKLLSHNEIEPYLVQLNNVFSVSDSNFWKCDVLLINIPPSLKKQTAESYLKQISDLVSVIELSGIKKVIFISSTSVYPELNKTITGVDEVDENSALLQSERLFTRSAAFKTTVIRFGGLIGPGRLPSRFFAGKTNIPNGNAPVNLIHLDDCIGVIEAVLQHDKFGETYHAASPTHPSRKEFYTDAARKAGLVLPEFIDELRDWKIIDPVKIEQDLGYKIGSLS